jgi:hypothetical protein
MSVEFVIDAYLETVKREGSIVSLVLYRLFSKYTNESAAKKVGMKPPEKEGLEGSKQRQTTRLLASSWVPQTAR